MQRRRILTFAASTVGAVAAAPALSTYAATALPAADTYRAGEHFHLVSNPIAPTNPNVVEVVEVFSYMCIHCFNFDTPVEAWQRKLPEGASFRRSPAVFSPSWKVMAQAFYTAEALGVLEQLHKPMFNALHVDRINIAHERILGRFFQENAGVDPADFERAWQSFAVVAAVEQADSRSKIWGVNAVPQLVVNGKYRLDGQLLRGSNVGMLQVAEWLVARELAAV